MLRLPVDVIDAVMILHDGERTVVRVFVPPGEDISQRLADARPFLPVVQASKTCLVARAAIACFGVPTHQASALDGLASEHQAVRVKLRSGVMLEGVMRWSAAPDHQRTVDHLNAETPYLVVHGHDLVYIVVKAHLVMVTEILMLTIPALLRFAVEQRASDLHVSAGEAPMLRIDGEMVRVDAPALSKEDTHRLIFDVMNDAQRRTFQDKLEVDFAFALDETSRFRVNAFVQNRGEGAVFRTIPTKIPRFEELGLPAVMRQFCEAEKGLVLVTGPTGSGKSTTLAAMIDHLNETMSGHILTLEDPIEFVHTPKRALVNQREVGTQTQSFNDALRSRAARGPGRDPRRRAPRSRDHRARAHRRGDRPPRVRDRAHVERAQDGRSHHRRVPGGAAGAGPDDALGVPARRVHPDAAPEDRRRSRAPPSRSSSAPPRCGT